MTGNERISVLVADYDRWTRLNLSTMLDAAGFSVDQASNGVAALRIAQITQPQIVLLRYNLPEIGARDVLATLQADPRTRHCAVVQLTEPGTAESELAVDGRLDLPCHPIELLAAVMDALEARHVQQRRRRQLELGVPMRSVSASTRAPVPLVASGAA